MNLNLNLNWSALFALFVLIAQSLSNLISLEPADKHKLIYNLCLVVAGGYCLLKFFNIDVVQGLFGLLPLFWFQVVLICIIVFIAVLPPIFAKKDRKKSEDAVSEEYIINNLKYNLLGAIGVIVMLLIAFNEIENFDFLKKYYIKDIASICIPISTILVFAYQHTEQNTETPDHDSSLKWINQMFNMLYLFVVYFFALISILTLVSYTLFGYVNSKPLELNFLYLIFLSIIYIFFFAFVGHHKEYVYMNSVIYVPIILVASVYWMSWFVIDKKIMQWFELVYIIGVLVVYITCIYIRKKNLLLGSEARNNTSGSYIRILSNVKIENLYYLIPYILFLIFFVLLSIIIYIL